MNNNNNDSSKKLSIKCTPNKFLFKYETKYINKKNRYLVLLKLLNTINKSLTKKNLLNNIIVIHLLIFCEIRSLLLIFKSYVFLFILI